MSAELDTPWNLGTHFQIIKGSSIDNDEYFSDGWYVDASSYKSTIEGTLHYFRSYRNDGKDYMRTFKTGWGKSSG